MLQRFAARLACIVALAVSLPAPGAGIGRTLASLSLLAACCSVAGAALAREPKFAPVLTGWDEAAAHAVIGILARQAAGL